jgi:hypothetical protein
MPEGVTIATTGGVFLETRVFFSFTGVGSTTFTGGVSTGAVVDGSEIAGVAVTAAAAAFLPRPRELILVC